MEEWKDRCDCCGKTGDPMFARIFYRKIKDKWQWLCSVCWVENQYYLFFIYNVIVRFNAL